MRRVAAINMDEYQFVLQCDQRFHDGLIFSFINYSFQNELSDEHCPLPISFLFALILEWFLNKITDKKSNAICIFVNLCSTLFSLWFKFFSTWFYFLSKCTKERGKKLTAKNLNIDRQFSQNVIRIFLMLLCLT